MKKISVSKIIIAIFTVLLTLSLILFIVTGIREIKDVDYESSYYTEETYLSTLNHEEYMELLRITLLDSKLGKSHSENILACQAVARYYEAATLYKALQDYGDAPGAALQLKRMEQYAPQTGDYQNHIEKINTLLAQ